MCHDDGHGSCGDVGSSGGSGRSDHDGGGSGDDGGSDGEGSNMVVMVKQELLISMIHAGLAFGNSFGNQNTCHKPCMLHR